MKNIAAALLKAQQALDPIKKGRKGHNYKYADLAAVLDEVVQELNAVGVVVMQPIMPASQPHHARVDTILIHADSGETITSSAEVPWKSEARMNDAQSYGSAITYARRYALVSIMGVATEDDDGASAVKKGPSDTVVAGYRMAIETCSSLDELRGVWKQISDSGHMTDQLTDLVNIRKKELEA